MKLTIPDFCLVVLIGTSGSGKSTFAARHFKPTEVISSDFCRGLVDDDESSLDATSDAFALVHFITERRLSRRKLAVIDATNVRREDRAHLVAIAKRHHALAVAIILTPGEEICWERNKSRPDRQFGPHVIRNQTATLKRGVRKLEREGFRYMHEFSDPSVIDGIEIVRESLWTDVRHESGPFDIIGDVHGCADELEELLVNLGYRVEAFEHDGERDYRVAAKSGRRAFFVGDLVDRGPRTPDVLRIVMAMVEAGEAFCAPGNHDMKFLRWLNGRKVKMTHGLEQSAEQMAVTSDRFKDRVKSFLDGLVSHAWLDGGKLVISHAGIKEGMIGRSSAAVREFCLFGDTTGESDEYGLPIRQNWAADFHGSTAVVYGHTPVIEAQWLNNTICIDTGCVFGGALTALRWPEKELVSVPAREVYCEPVRPMGAAPANALSLQHAHDDLLDLSFVTGKRIVETRLSRAMTINEANASVALEVMARFAVHPKWLIYLPPTMSPSATSKREGFLEHPEEAFAYYQSEGVTELVVQEKHMGSRALIIVCRDEAAARERFGVANRDTGMIYTRTGRPFFSEAPLRDQMLSRLRRVLDEVDFWSRHQTNWVLLDAEIMPWSAKAQSLIRKQYATTAASARTGLGYAVSLLAEAGQRNAEVKPLLDHFTDRRVRAEKYVAAYRRYCWPVGSIEDYRIAPFHVIATEGAIHMDKDHLWHMAEILRLASTGDSIVMGTPHRVVHVEDTATVLEAIDWWLKLTEAGGEGIVVKPKSFIARGKKGLVQPAVKCRGKEYLRIIYGPEYDAPQHLHRLRSRGLGKKRSLALREFVLGHEALSRFIEREPLTRVHEAVFAVLALESEPLDPRL